MADAGSVDAGTADAGPVDAGPTDAGTGDAESWSCAGIATCVQGLSPITAAGVAGCNENGTVSASYDFSQLMACATNQGCASGDPSCLNTIIADGGACSSQWDTCEAQGASCGALVGCAFAALEGGTDPKPCALSGTAVAAELAQNLETCLQSACSAADAGNLLHCYDTKGNGECTSQTTACQNDTSGASDGG